MLVEFHSYVWGAAVGGAAAGGIMGWIGDVISNAYGQHNAKVAFRRQKTIMKNMIQWRVKDLVKAGLNPMLAVGAGVGGASANVQQAQGQESDLGADASRMMEAVLSAGRQPATVENIVANTAKAGAEADESVQRAKTGAAQEKLAGTQNLVETMKIPEIQSQINLNAANAARATKEAGGVESAIKLREAEARRTQSGWAGIFPQSLRDAFSHVAKDAVQNWTDLYNRAAEGVSSGARDVMERLEHPKGKVGTLPPGQRRYR